MHSSSRIRFAFCAKASHKGPNFFCRRFLVPRPLHMKKELTHHDRTALPFHEGSGPAASPPAVAAPDYSQSDTWENLPLLTCNCTSLHFAFRFDVQ